MHIGQGPDEHISQCHKFKFMRTDLLHFTDHVPIKVIFAVAQIIMKFSDFGLSTSVFNIEIYVVMVSGLQ